MLTLPLFTAIVLTTVPFDRTTGIVTRAEQTEFRLSDGTLLRRVEKNSEGKVVRLRLDGMQLFHEEFAEIARLTELRNLGLYKTNTTDADLRQIRTLPKLQSINLTNTEITDAVIDELMQLESLKTEN